MTSTSIATGSFSVARAVLGKSGGGAPGRTLLATAAIALGVALGFAVHLINRTAIAEFTAGAAALSGTADLQIRGPRAGFDEKLYPTIARNTMFAAVSPVLEVEAKLARSDEPLTIVGIDAFRATAVTPALIGEARDSVDLLRPDALFVTPAAARALRVDVGDTIDVVVGVRPKRLRIAGFTHAEADERFAVMDIAAAQDTFDRIGRLTRIDVRLRAGSDVEAAQRALAPLLPAGISATPPAETAGAFARLTRAYRVNLDVLALVALFTGALLVFSTQSLGVVRRRLQFALLRTLGLTRQRLIALVVAEGALLGLAGAVAGIFAGYAMATIATRWFGADLGAGFFRGDEARVVFEPIAALGFGALGVVAAVAGSLVPAREASRAAPAAALKAGDEQSAFGAIFTPRPGLAMIAVGALLPLAPPIAGLPLAGYGAIALILVGAIMLMPWIAVRVLALVPRPAPPPLALALDQIRGAPAQAAVSLAAVVAGVSLMVSMAIMVTSFRHSLDDWLSKLLPADLYVRAGFADSAYLSPGDQRTIAALPGIERVEFVRVQSVLLDPSRPRVSVLAREIPANDPASRLPLVSTLASLPADRPPAWVSESAADLYGLKLGQPLALPLAGRAVTFVVAGIWRDYARQQGAIVIERERYRAITGDGDANDAALWLARGSDGEALRRRIRQAFGDGVTIATPGEIRDLSLSAFDRTFAVTYALEAVAVVIGLVGLSSSFGALVLSRRREFGVLRHLGMTKRQVGTMLATEGFALGAIGLAAGLTLGFVISLILIQVVNRQSFHWGMDLHVPWLGLATLVVVLVTLATLTALVSARRAMSAEAVRAVKDDW
jgi:putative ABC transport system permease protein